MNITPNHENTNQEEPINLLSTIPPKEFPQTYNASNYYYVVKKTILKKNAPNTSTEEFEFNNADLLTSKMNARFFYDSLLNEEEENEEEQQSKALKVELFLIQKESNTSTQSFLLISSETGINTVNKNIESTIINAQTKNKSFNNNDSNRTINSFLDNHYKD